jgi:multiple sugar transport system permease protein
VTTKLTETQALPRTRTRRGILPKPDVLRENLTGWIFVSPALLLVSIFGLLPIGFAFYMSLHRWILTRGDFFCTDDFSKPIGEWEWAGLRDLRAAIADIEIADCFQHYTESAVGDWGGLAITMLGFGVLLGCFWFWTNSHAKRRNRRMLVQGAVVLGIILITLGIVASEARWNGFVYVLLGVAVLGGAYWFWKLAFEMEGLTVTLIRWGLALAVLAIGLAAVAQGWTIMTDALSRRNQDFLDGLQITVYYAFGSVPIQLTLGLILAYVLFQNIFAKEAYRMIFFLPYVTPAVAAAVVFGTVFNGNDTSLANQVLNLFGFDSYRWISEPRPFLNVVFGLNLDGFLAGPSMALVSVIILGVWTYTGYNAVIFLAGLGTIPSDLYEAAKVDGANQWHLFRHITLPLLSPITFYLSVLAFIGTFKAFNTLFVMRTPASQGTLDTAGLVIFDTFRTQSKYGEATAQAILLFLIILAITQIQRKLFEKRVFYG